MLAPYTRFFMQIQKIDYFLCEFKRKTFDVKMSDYVQNDVIEIQVCVQM